MFGREKGPEGLSPGMSDLMNEYVRGHVFGEMNEPDAEAGPSATEEEPDTAPEENIA